jgi:phenylpropionate dioxygenase-like ring-hydroxylating dioxygenase large terminal subunit
MSDTTPQPAPTSSPAWDMVLPRRSANTAGATESASSPDREVPHATGAVAPEDLRYRLIDRPEPPPVPNGWYAAASSASLEAGQVASFVAVERHLVVFRDAEGAAHVLDAHCPHMGAHLGGGSVHGDTLQCPYHGWRYGGDGTVVEIPYAKGAHIPSKACVRSYPVAEQDGLVLFWYHAAGAEPAYAVPTFDEAQDPTWSAPHEYHGELVASLQDMAENNVDYTHFYFVHGRDALDESTSQFRTDGPFSTVVERFEEQDLTFTRYTYGPGIALIRIPNLATVLTTTTPIDRRHVRLLWHFYFPPGLEAVADDIIDGVVGPHGLGADEPIWRDKVFLERPLLVKGDGPITEFRRWYEQFYEGSRPTPPEHDRIE